MKNSNSPKMEQEIQTLQKDIINLMENSRIIQNFNNIPECLKNIQLRPLSKLKARARAKKYVMDRQMCNLKFRA